MAEPDLLIEAGFSDAKLTAEVNKLVAKYKQAGEAAQKAFKDSTDQVGDSQALKAHMRELDRLQRAYDPVYTATQKYEAAVRKLDRALQVGAIDQAKYTAEIKRAQVELGQVSGVIDTVQRGTRGFGGNLSNIGFQIGDFATQVGAGTSATQALGQQLPQLLGGFGAVGAGAGAAAAILIPLGAAILGAARDSETLEDQMAALEKSTDAMAAAAEVAAIPISELAARYGDLAGAIASANSAMAMMTAIQAKNDAVGATRGLSSALGLDVNPDPVRTWTGSSYAELPGSQQAAQEDAMKRLRRETGATAEQAERLRAALARTDSVNTLPDVTRDAGELLQAIKDIYAQADKEQRAFLDNLVAQTGAALNAATRQIETEKQARQSLIQTYDASTQELAKLADQMETAERERAKAVSAGLKEEVSMWDRIIDKIREALRETRAAAAEADKMMDRGLFFTGPYQAPPDSRGSAFTTTREMISRFEGGYQPDPYWDVNKYRAGYGSETYVTADGVTKAVVAGVRVSKEDADRDLDQRILRYFEEQRNVVGPAWISFTDNQKAALASIQHNYGSIPDRLKPALSTGDAQTIATAIAGLAMDYTRTEKRDGSPVNYNRRMQEAAAFGDTSAQAGRNADENQRLQQDIRERERKLELAKQYGEQLAANLLTEQQTAQLEAQRAQAIAAINASGMTDTDKAAAIAQVNAEMQRQVTIMALVAEAQRRGVDLDAQMIDSTLTYRDAIAALGDAQYGRAIAEQQAAAASDQLRQSQEFAAEQTQALKGGLVDAIIEGENFADVIGNVAKQLAKASLQAALFGEGPLAGLFGIGEGGGFLSGAFSWLTGGVSGNDVLSQALRNTGGFGGFRAAGGPVNPGRAYVVGEEGPEIIVPSSAGQVIPNHALNAAPSSVTFAPSINIGTTDDRTAAQIEAALSREQARFFSRWQQAQKEHAQRFA